MTDHPEALQRLRLTFTVHGPMRYVSVLDMGRIWERLLRRAGLPLAYSQGFNPRPRLIFADALPVGYASRCELLDIYLDAPLEAAEVRQRAVAQCPAGIEILACQSVALDAPKPQAQMRAAEYELIFVSSMDGPHLSAAVDALLQSVALPRVRLRQGQELAYDLRPLLHALTYAGQRDDGTHALWLRVKCGSNGAGRPDEVLAALDTTAQPLAICRTRLIWGEDEEDTP